MSSEILMDITTRTTKDIEVGYRGFLIKTKRDFGSRPFWVDGRFVTTGFVVVKDGANAMPGATWFLSVKDAQRAIDILLAFPPSPTDARQFWRAMRFVDSEFGLQAAIDAFKRHESSGGLERPHSPVAPDESPEPDYGGGLAADGQVYSDADPGL